MPNAVAISRLRHLAVAIAILTLPNLLSAQSIRPPASGANLRIRGCELVLHARNSGKDAVTVDLAASTAQAGTGPWESVLGAATNAASALRFIVPANSPSVRHVFNSWLFCAEKQRYKFAVLVGNATRPLIYEFPGSAGYTTDLSLRLGDLGTVR